MRHGSSQRGSAHLSSKRRLTVYLVLGTLWLSGCAWLGLDQFFSTVTAFGRTPHPWQPPLLTAHGILAILSMSLFGWMSERHMLRGWRLGRRRLSGGALIAAAVLLALSGFGLFFLTSDRAQHTAALTHDVLGLGITVLALEHWVWGRRRTNAPTEDARRRPVSSPRRR